LNKIVRLEIGLFLSIGISVRYCVLAVCCTIRNNRDFKCSNRILWRRFDSVRLSTFGK